MSEMLDPVFDGTNADPDCPASRGLLKRRQALTGMAAVLLASGVHAQRFPSKPIKLVLDAPPGATLDVVARVMAQSLGDMLGTVIIENRPGAVGQLAANEVKSAPADGHTLLLGTAAMMTVYPHAYKKISYDPFRDFEPIINAASFDLAMVVHRSVPVDSLAQFIEWAKAQPHPPSFASYGAGSLSHFLGELLNRSAGLKMVHVPYRGSSPARQDLMAGTVPVMFDTAGGAMSTASSGRGKVLASSGSKRSPMMPAVPTFAELGYPDVLASSWMAFFAPAGTPRPVIARLHDALLKAVNTREVRRQLLLNGLYPIGDGADELRNTIKQESQRWGEVIKAIGFAASS